MNIFITPLSDKAAPVLQTKPIGSATAHLRFKRGSSVPLTVTLLGVTEASNLRIGMKRRDRYESPLLAYAAAATPDEAEGSSETSPTGVRFTLLLHVNSEELDNALGVGAGDSADVPGAVPAVTEICWEENGTPRISDSVPTVIANDIVRMTEDAPQSEQGSYPLPELLATKGWVNDLHAGAGQYGLVELEDGTELEDGHYSAVALTAGGAIGVPRATASVHGTVKLGTSRSLPDTTGILPVGEHGADGGLAVDASGLSAYALAKASGFEGTEEEWLESLKGEKGDKGDTGEAGAQGAPETVLRTKETQQGTGNVLWNYAVLDASLVLPGYLKKIELKCRTTGSPAGAFFPGVYQQPLGGGSAPSAWTFLGASTNSLTQSNNAWVEWAFPDGLELAEGRPIALMAMATATAGWTMDTQIGGRSVARGGEQPPAGKTLERQRQFFAGLGLTYSIGNTIIIRLQTEICPRINHYSNTVMKRTMFITMLAAALVGSQVFAGYIPTTTDAGKVDDVFYVGKYSQTEDVSGANVTINEKQEGGEDFSQIEVYGGFTIGEQAAASNNSVTMTGGQVAAVEGGYSNSGHANNNKTTMTGGQVSTLSGGTGQTSASENTAIMVGGSVISSMFGGQSGKDASGNTAIMDGGSVGNMIGGRSGGGFGQTSASGNIAIVAGDSVVSHTLAGGLIPFGGAANDNKIYLVGKGATATIADAQGNTDTYRGGAISLNNVCGGKGSVSAGNSIDIYGTGITVSSSVQDMQILNFHIANLDDGATPMITLPSRLDLTKFLVPTEEDPSHEWALTFDALDSMEWKPGASVTLVNAGGGIGIDASLLGKEYNIYRNGDPVKTVLGTATLKLEQGEGNTEILKLVTNGNVPEPTTGILSLLALAALTARRRK